MSILSGTAIKIFNFLGLTALGQTTKSGSVPVTLASDQDALPITDNSGSLTIDAPVGTPAFVRLSDGTSPVSIVSGRLAVNGSGVLQPVTQSGTWTVQPGNTANTTAWKVDGSAVTQPVSAASLPLPSGAATETTLGAVNTATGAQADSAWVSGSGSIIAILKAIFGRIAAFGTAGTPSTNVLSVQGVPGATAIATTVSSVSGVVHVDDNSSTLSMDDGGGSITVDAAALPLPTGAATEATVAALAQEGTNITGASMPAGGAHLMGWLSAIWKLLNGGLPTALGAGGGLKVDGSGTALPVSGTFWQSTQPVSAASLPLPSGAATAAKQPALGTAGSPSADVLTVQGTASGTALPVSGTITDQAATSQQDFTFTCVNTAGTNVGATITGLGPYRSAAFYCNVQGNTGGTLDIYLQWSPDGGTTWVDYAHLPQLAAGAATTLRMFTIARAGQQLTIATVGNATSPALAVNTVVGGDWGDRLRVIYSSGIGTTLGKQQIIKASFTT